jgi:uncharacterized Fe-S cluster-containing radical SAM superfamily protein
MSPVADTPLPVNSPPSFHLLAKPRGATCNIDCKYCFFLSKEALYPNDKQRMSENTLETYIRQLLESHRTPQVTVAWQGGEPTLMKLDFFRRSVEIVEEYRRPGQVVQHTFQTNGILLDEDWCAFFKEHNFLVGLSVDGPREIHDTNRVDRGGQGTFKHTRPAMRTMAQLLQQRRPPSDVMALTAVEDDRRGPYQPCPCGSGQKFSFCHGNNAPRTPFSGVNPAADAPQDGRVTPVRDEPQTVSYAAYGAST